MTTSNDAPVSVPFTRGREPNLRDPFPHLVSGYPKLAGYMEAKPENASFRRFGALNARNLLYLQNRLSYLEVQLQKQEQEDSKSNSDCKRRYAIDYIWVDTADHEVNGQLRDGDTRQRDLLLEMQQLLNQYNKALIQQHIILRMDKPDHFSMSDIQRFLGNPPMGYYDRPFLGADRDIWGSFLHPEGYSRDLVSIGERIEHNGFSWFLGWLISCLLARCYNAWRRVFATTKTNDEISCFQKEHRAKKQAFDVFETITGFEWLISKILYWVTGGLASALPIISIVVLDRTPNKRTRIGVIAAFDVALGLCLTMFAKNANLKRSQIFQCVAAFAAVQVVFVGTSAGTSGNSGGT